MANRSVTLSNGAICNVIIVRVDTIGIMIDKLAVVTIKAREIGEKVNPKGPARNIMPKGLLDYLLD
jgi:hypothetical protein